MLQWLFGKKKQEAPRPQKPKEEQQAQDKWKFDFLVQFLCGPLWKTSILDFVDYHCVVFDNEQQNKFEYTTLHNKFKELVANLFDGMIQQIGLDQQKLAQLLEKGFQGKHKKIFNQLLLADDYSRFKQLMVNRNKTLEEQAIKALRESSQPRPEEQKKQKKPQKFQKDVIKESKRTQEERLRKIQLEQQEQLRRVLQMSRVEAEEKEMISKLEMKATEQQLRKSQQPVENIRKKPNKTEVKRQAEAQVKKEVKQQVREEVRQQVRQQEQPLSVSQKPKSKLSSLDPLPPVRGKKADISPQVQKPKIIEQQQERQKQESKPSPVVQKQAREQVENQEERKRRLMEQREKIRKKKEQERKKQLADEQAKPSANPVQTIVLQQQRINETQQKGGQQQKGSKVNKEQIQRRRALMKKIKNRIVDDF